MLLISSLLFLCRSIRSVCEVCGQVSSKSWYFCGTETLNVGAFRTQSKHWGTWWTHPATSHWATLCMCKSHHKVFKVKLKFALLFKDLLIVYVHSFHFIIFRYVSPLTTSYAGTHRTLRSIGGGALSLDVIRSWLCSKWLRSVENDFAVILCFLFNIIVCIILDDWCWMMADLMNYTHLNHTVWWHSCNVDVFKKTLRWSWWRQKVVMTHEIMVTS